MEFVNISVRPKPVSASPVNTNIVRRSPVSCTDARVETSIVRGMYNVRIAELSPEQLMRLETKLTVKPRVNPNFSSLYAKGYPLFRRTKTWFSMPRFYGLKEFGLPTESRTSNGDVMNVSLNMTPRDYQCDVLDAIAGVFTGDSSVGSGAILEADCGTGKTAMGIATAVRHGRKNGHRGAQV